MGIGLVFVGFLLRLSRWESFNPRITRLSVSLRVGIVGIGALILATRKGWLSRTAIENAWVGGAPETWPSEAAGIGLMVLGVTVFLKHAGHGLLGGQLSLGLLSLLSLTGLLGHLYGARGAGSGLMMEPAAALMMLVAALTLLYLQSNRGLLSVVVADSMGGIMARRLLPASILVPIALGWLRMVAEDSGWLSPSVGLLVHVLASIAVMVVIVWRSATVLANTSQQKHQTGQQFQDIETSYRNLLDLMYQPVFGYNSDGNVTYMNGAARQLFSIGLGEDIGLNVPDLVGDAAWKSSFAPLLLGMNEQRKVRGTKCWKA